MKFTSSILVLVLALAAGWAVPASGLTVDLNCSAPFFDGVIECAATVADAAGPVSFTWTDQPDTTCYQNVFHPDTIECHYAPVCGARENRGAIPISFQADVSVEATDGVDIVEAETTTWVKCPQDLKL